MVYITGDTHGDYERFSDPYLKRLDEDDTLIICGDFGFIWDGTGRELSTLRKLAQKKYTIAFVDGCHENFDILERDYPLKRWNGGIVREIAPNIVHLQRGEIYTIEDETYFTFGGGHSQDVEYRLETGNWWKREQPTHEEIRHAIYKLREVDSKVDYIITHEPPASLKDCLGIDVNQRLEIHAFFEDIIKVVEYKRWFFGKCHVDKFIPIKFNAVFEEILPVEQRRSRLWEKGGFWGRLFGER